MILRHLEDSELVLTPGIEERWQNLCHRSLPIAAKDSFWRFSRMITEQEPVQGWKLHISATVLSAITVLNSVSNFLCTNDILYKAPSSLLELKKLNCGLFYGFSQVGKFITVYPRTTEEAVDTAFALEELTKGLQGPRVPYDRQLRHGSIVHYRYGAFRNSTKSHTDDEMSDSIVDPDGTLLPDLRTPEWAVPPWLSDPFEDRSILGPSDSMTQIPERFRAYAALSHRGKGGIYRALDMSTSPPRQCIMKEGRINGETDWDGTDGYSRVIHEANVLNELSANGCNVPEIYDSFTSGSNFYLILEYIEGDNLQDILISNQGRISINEALRISLQISYLLESVHVSGWVWRDCKPLNLIRSDDGLIYGIDFEGACKVDSLNDMPWGTSGYIPPEWLERPTNGTRQLEDLHALGATIHHLVTGKPPDATPPLRPIGKMRRHVPIATRNIVSSLTALNPSMRPNLDDVKAALTVSLQEL